MADLGGPEVGGGEIGNVFALYVLDRDFLDYLIACCASKHVRLAKALASALEGFPNSLCARASASDEDGHADGHADGLTPMRLNKFYDRIKHMQ